MAKRETKTLSLTPEHAAFLSACVATGRYQSASEVVRAALRLLEAHETDLSSERERVRRLVQDGADQLDRGQVVDGDEVFAKLAKKHERLRQGTSRR